MLVGRVLLISIAPWGTGAAGPKLFQIIRVFDVTRLPQANTCFNELLLPPYSSKERLADLLVMAILDGGVRNRSQHTPNEA